MKSATITLNVIVESPRALLAHVIKTVGPAMCISTEEIIHSALTEEGEIDTHYLLSMALDPGSNVPGVKVHECSVEIAFGYVENELGEFSIKEVATQHTE